MSRTKQRMQMLILLVLDIAMILMESSVLGQEWRASGARTLRYYTQDSNILALLVCSICAVSELVCLLRNHLLPKWMRIIRYISACCLMVTMIVAIAILVPSGTSGSFASFMLDGNLLYLHTVCPLVMLLGWLVHTGVPFGAKHALLAIAPTVVYGAITMVMNIKRIYRGPYFFFEVYRQPLSTTLWWMVIILGGNFLLAWGLGKIHLPWQKKIQGN